MTEATKIESAAPTADGALALWLATLCRPENRAINRPVSILLGGEVWSGATDGHAFVFVKSAAVDNGFAPAAILVDQVWPGSFEFNTPFAEIVAWAQRRERCTECGSTGVVPSGVLGFDSAGNGPISGLLHGCPCCANSASGVLEGQPLNRRLLLKFLGELTAEKVNLARKGTMVGVRAPDWLLVVCGLELEKDDTPGEEFRPSVVVVDRARAESDASKAITYVLDRAQTDPDLGYLVGPMTEVFRLLCQAEATARGESLGAVEARRGKSLVPPHREKRPEVLRLRDEAERLRELLPDGGR